MERRIVIHDEEIKNCNVWEKRKVCVRDFWTLRIRHAGQRIEKTEGLEGGNSKFLEILS